MNRRKFLSATGASASVLVAGCVSNSDEESDDPLVVGTYSAFIDAPSTSPGAWIKEQFEEEFDARLIWQTPNNDVNYYIERHNADVDIEADLYVGLNVDDLVRIDEAIDNALFQETTDLSGLDDINPGLQFDPQNRAIPYDTGYISLVYDSTQLTAPDTFEGLLDEELRGALITQNPATSTTGRAFLLHTIHYFDPDGYLEYWDDLQANDARVLGSWGDAYNAWLQGEAPIVVSYSTDQVFAAAEGADLDEHQIRFLNDQAYANPEGMAVFENANQPELAREFMSFLLRPEVQGEIAERNVQFPATTTAELPGDYADLAHEPPEPVTFTYDDLQGNLNQWIENWERQFAEN